MAVTTPLMTVGEFHKLPEDAGPFYHELRHGELVLVRRPKLKHIQIQKRCERFLEAAAGEAGVVAVEFSFRPVPEYELRVADVAYISRSRWEQADPEGDFPGAPDLVIEVLSPSNTAAEIYGKEQICLENGAQQFWVIDPDRHQIKVATPDGRTITYRSGEEIALPLFGSTAVAVDAVFQGLKG